MKSLIITFSFCMILGSQNLLAQSSDEASESYTSLKSKADSLFYSANRYDKAIILYEKILEDDSSSVSVYEPLTKAYAALGLFDQAERRARELYLTDSEDDLLQGNYYCRMALFTTMQQKYEAALAHVDTMITVFDNDMIYPGAPACAVRFETRAGAFEAAGDHLEQLLSVTSGIDQAQFLPWAVYVARKQGKTELADKYLSIATQFQQMVESDTFSLEQVTSEVVGSNLAQHEIDIWLAQVKALKGNSEEAINYLEKAYNNGARSYYRIKNEKAAFISLQDEPRFQKLMDHMRKDVEEMKENLMSMDMDLQQNE